jgi:hypothetical protein
LSGNIDDTIAKCGGVTFSGEETATAQKH